MRRLQWFCYWSRPSVFTWLVLSAALLSSQTEAACRLPVQGSWLRADDGQNITFSRSGVLQGHRLETGATGEAFASFDCLSAKDDKYVFGLPGAVDGDGGKVMAYFCWKLDKSTQITWLLYPLTPEATAGTFANHKAFEAMANDTTPSLAEVCSLKPEDVIPTLLYKTADTSSTDVDLQTITEAERQCPAEIQAGYSYVQTAVSDTSCRGAQQVDFCEDGRTARLNSTACRASGFFSEGGILSCTASFTHEGDIYVMLVNHDSAVDYSRYFRFACMKVQNAARRGDQRHKQLLGIKEESVKSTTVTLYPGDCAATSGTHQLAFTRIKTCEKAGKGSSDDDNPMVLIIAVVVGVDAAALVGVFVCLYCKAKANRKKRLARYRQGHDNEIEETELEGMNSPSGVWGSTRLAINGAPAAANGELNRGSRGRGGGELVRNEPDPAADTGVPAPNGQPRMSLSSDVDSEPGAGAEEKPLDEYEPVTTHM